MGVRTSTFIDCYEEIMALRRILTYKAMSRMTGVPADTLKDQIYANRHGLQKKDAAVKIKEIYGEFKKKGWI